MRSNTMKRVTDDFTDLQLKTLPDRKIGFYEKYVKRFLDIICGVSAFFCFLPLYAGVAALVRIRLGSPVLFRQPPDPGDTAGTEPDFQV